MKKTLLVDTNRASIPIFRELTRKGHDITVIGNNKQEPLAKICKNYCSIDYSDMKNLKQFIKENNFNHFVPGCTDVSYRVLSEIIGDIDHNNIDKIETFKTIYEKDKFKELAYNLNLSVARRITKDNLNDIKEIIIKPNNSHSGIGIKRISHPTNEQVDKAIKNAKDQGESENVVIEEFIEGQLYSHSAVIINDRIAKDFFVKEDNSKGHFSVDTSCIDGTLESEIKESVRREINLIISNLELKSGIIHTQFIYTGSNYFLLECTRRCPGDLYSLLIKYATGYNYAKSYLEPFINEIPNLNKNIVDEAKYIIRHTISNENQLFFNLNFNKSVKIKSFFPLISTCKTSNMQAQRIAICFFESKTLEEHNNLYEMIMEKKLYSFDI